jgi:DNA repair exonuclease SbcCD ATPase subunit
LSGDVFGALAQMTKNLARFNSTFSVNTQELRSTLEGVHESYKHQAEIFKNINKLKISEIATANIRIYDHLKNCTNEIGLLGEYLENVKTYLIDVHRSITNADIYFKKEIDQIDERKGIINKAVGGIDNHLQNVISELRKNSNTHIEELKKSTVRQTESLKEAIKEQQETLNKKLQETSLIVSELRNLSDVRSSMDKLVQIANSQNQKIDKLTHAISELIQMKTESTGFFIPQWVKISAILGFGIISIFCLIFLVKELIKAMIYFFPL